MLTTFLPYKEKALERDMILFKWKSDSIKLPYCPEFWLTTRGALGFLKNEQRWVSGAFTGETDEYGDFSKFVYYSLDTNKVKTGEAKNHEEIIVCGNTPTYRPFEKERAFYAMMKQETDESILCQLINSRLNKAFLAMNDQQKKQIEKAYDSVRRGYPMILVTSLLEDLDTINLTDPQEIDKMQYLSAFYQTIEKREMNDNAVDLENVEKRAQINNTELKQYDDFTALQYLIMAEARQRFVDEMKENNFEIEIVRNPVFYDEPTKADVENGTFEAADAEPEAEPEETAEETTKEDAEDGKEDN